MFSHFSETVSRLTTSHYLPKVLIEDQDELILSIRGSANIDDIATDLACATCAFLDGYAHEGMAGAVAAVWEEANVKVLMLGWMN